MSEEVKKIVNVLALHIFSGVHLGARIDLPAGKWLLGSADDCDLILNGLAPHHALLNITQEQNGNVNITVTPKKGQVIVDGTEINGETSLPCNKALYLGETCLAWNLPNARQETILPRPTITSAEPDVNKASPPIETKTPETEKKIAQEENPVKIDENVNEIKPKQRTTFMQRLRRPFFLLLLAVLLCALSFTISNEPGREEYPAIISAMLEKIGLTDLSVAPKWLGVEIHGAVSTPADLERLQKAVQETSFPVYLEVAVDDDMLRAVRNSLGVRGFFPVVRMERSKGSPHLVIAAFMRDALVEAEAFAALEKDFPSPPTKERHIVHEKDVEPLISTALFNAGFSDLQPVYLPGRVSLTGNLDADRKPILARLKSNLSTQFGVPLFGEDTVSSIAPTVLSSNRGISLTPPAHTYRETPNPEQPQVASDPLGGLKLTGVFIAPLSFITTEDGQRLFKGSVLPNGNILENINTSELKLRRGNKIVTYKLRGKHD